MKNIILNKKKEYIIFFKNSLKLIFRRIKIFLIKEKTHHTEISYIVEKENWSIKWDGIYISSAINKSLNTNIISINDLPTISSKTKIMHFGSQYMWVDWQKLLPKDKNYVVSFYHGKKSDSDEVKKHIENFIKTKESIYKVITASSLIEERLIYWGIAKSKIEKIPIGVDTNLFSIPTDDERNNIRKKLGFKENQIIIGSFQKDGHGWSEGNIPKLIKGPDIFVKAVEIISQKFPVVVLLTGPARGYVKKELAERKIKFVHNFISSYKEIANYYKALDLYIVSSREEGGPKAIVESMASGVPLISTNVGMACDFINDRKNGFLINSFDPEEIAQKSIESLSKSNKMDIIKNARKDVMRADWNNLRQIYWEKVYKPGL